MHYFFDTEFIERGPTEPIKLLSIGVVATDGREFYWEHPVAAEMVEQDFQQYGDSWLQLNVLPSLNDTTEDSYRRVGESLDELKHRLIDFCDPEKYGQPQFWAYYAGYDWVVLCQIFGRMIDLPSGWPMFCNDLRQLVGMFPAIDPLPPQIRPNELPEHHALNDARWTKRAWEYAKNELDSVHPLDLSYRL